MLLKEIAGQGTVSGRPTVMAKCEICGKTPMFGHNVSHSKRHTKRRWMPNVHKTRVATGGRVKRLNLCTRCIRTQHKLGH